MEVELAINTFFVLFCTFLLIWTILGISLFYSGLTQRRSSLTLLASSLLFYALVLVDWYIWGYSLCYSPSNNRFIGSLDYAVLRHLSNPSYYLYATSTRGDIASVVHFLFNGHIKLTCVALTFPACAAERGRLMPMLVFVLLWSAIVYNPVVFWFWNDNGWLAVQNSKYPVLDFAGGNCVHIVSGFTALAYSFYVGPRNPKTLEDYRSSNNSFVVLGLFFVLTGWCGFIAGCDFNFSYNALYIITETLLCACTAGMIWMAIDYYFSAIPLGDCEEIQDIELQNMGASNCLPYSLRGDGTNATREKATKMQRSISVVSFSSGMMCGLVVFTPGGGYVSSGLTIWKAIVFGVVGGAAGNIGTRLKYFLRVDDALDIFSVHGVCGVVGSLMVGIFADDVLGSKGGWVSGNWIQVPYQILGVVVTAVYVFLVNLCLLFIVDHIPGLHLRIDKEYKKRLRHNSDHNNTDSEPRYPTRSEKAELQGSDAYDLNGEFSMDYMEFIRVINPDDYATEPLIYYDQEYRHENTFVHQDEHEGLRKRGVQEHN
ncbi:hypothetical protein PUMCH_002002 [Australozyma saopauloensis]|uniref:Ammonium transporter AmtB-like domain-containing protein n=1 Tax=Australozyma saopauloensis TaxID=291208 RepID=A0AAX4H8B3_9ASCO|nr:hypothetical protein PUMCH_002002 [[Candida] saopauloensis]